MVLFSAKDLKDIAAEIEKRQKFEGSWTDENGNEIDLCSDRVLSPVEKAQRGINLFIEELMRRFYDDSETEDSKEITYYSEETPHLT